jgi:hypothetical protein
MKLSTELMFFVFNAIYIIFKQSTKSVNNGFQWINDLKKDSLYETYEVAHDIKYG